MSTSSADYNAQIIDEFRANNGHVGGMWEGTPLLLLHHTGTKSGVSRLNPVAYLPDDRRYLIWAGNGGAPNNPDWYHNLMAHPNTRNEVGSETIDVVAEEAGGAERERRFARAAERYPQLAEVAREDQPGHPDDRPDARRERLSGSTARNADATRPAPGGAATTKAAASDDGGR